MTGLLLALACFLGWWVIGLAVLALTRADTSDLRVLLIAPALGSAITVVACFIFSFAGMSVDTVAVPLVAILLVSSVGALLLHRPALTWLAIPVLALCLVGLILMGWPMTSLGFHWLGNGNADMGDYVLRAVQLMHHGLFASLDSSGLNQGRDYATASVGANIWGERPGSEIVLALVARLTGRAVYQIYMPLSLALGLVTACGAGAFAMTAIRRSAVAIVAMILVLVSPLFTFGITQELLPQTWGLGFGVALLACAMRVELHRDPGARSRDYLPIGIVAAALVLVYVEITPEVAAAYGLYLTLIALRREVTLRALIRLWVPVTVIVIVLLNGYLFREINFLHAAASAGVRSEDPPLFGYTVVPSALPSLFGLQTLPPGAGAPMLDLSILAAVILVFVACAGAIASLRRPYAPAAALTVDAGLAVLLIAKGSDFGLFKLSMYVQPVLAGMIAVWALMAKRRYIQIPAMLLLALFIGTEFSTQLAYVKASRDPGEVPEVSSVDMLPAFSRMIASHTGPVVAVTENPFLIQVEAADAYGRPIAFLDRDMFAGYLSLYAQHTSGAQKAQVKREQKLYPWRKRAFNLHTGTAHDDFKEDLLASQYLTERGCHLVMPSGRTLVLNRLALPSSLPPIVDMPCSAAHDLLAFTESSLGESFYLPYSERHVSFAQIQSDPYVPGQTMSGFGRYALFRVLGPTRGMRLEFNFTTTLNGDGANRIPPVSVVGASRVQLPVDGNGSARVVSPPLIPQVINGQPYVLIDMGAVPREPPTPRSGVQALYSRRVPLDIRFLTSYVRDVSIISAQQYKGLQPPSALSSFPADLANPSLQYSGLYEDGWMGKRAYAVLASGPTADLVIRGEVPAGAGKHVTLLIDGKVVYSKPVAPGALSIKVPVDGSRQARKVELEFGETIHLAPPDGRPAAAHLTFLGFVPRGDGVTRHA